jgi:hypothetical protein
MFLVLTEGRLDKCTNTKVLLYNKHDIRDETSSFVETLMDHYDKLEELRNIAILNTFDLKNNETFILYSFLKDWRSLNKDGALFILNCKIWWI